MGRDIPEPAAPDVLGRVRFRQVLSREKLGVEAGDQDFLVLAAVEDADLAPRR